MKTIVLLGGCGGIGRALLKDLTDDGAKVVVLDLERSIKAHPVDAVTHPVDLNRSDTISQALAKLDEPVYGFVNLSGFMTDAGPLADKPHSEWDEVLGVNLRGAFIAAKAVIPVMEKGGSIVFVGSGLGHFARPGFGPYAVSKAGLAALGRQLALELAPDIRVNCVAPSAVDTAFLRGGTGRSDEASPIELDLDQYAKAIPLGRIGQPSDVVGPIKFLLSQAACYMTGQVLHVNGGAYMP